MAEIIQGSAINLSGEVIKNYFFTICATITASVQTLPPE